MGTTNLTVPATLIATSDPITIAKGIPLQHTFPTDKLSFGATATLFDTSYTYDHWYAPTVRLRARTGVAIEGGVVGPGYGLRMDVSGTVDDDQIELRIAQDEFVAGMILGVLATVDVRIDANVRALKLDTHLHHRFEADVIDLLISTVKTIGGLIPGVKKIVQFIPPVSTESLRDFKEGIVDSGGELRLEPSISGQFDLISFIETVVETGLDFTGVGAPAVEIIAEILDVIQKTGLLRFETGPYFGVEFPVNVSITGLAAWDASTRAESDTLTFAHGHVRGPHGASELPTSVEHVAMRFTHRKGIDLDLGWYAKVVMLKFIDVGHTWKFGVFEALGVDVFDAPETNEVQNRSGARSDSEIVVELVPPA
ncbi:MAG: hypothetical protein EA416_09950 [Trueperaceae bacterium]|nr:MAG: hypothetical protein EA416_09950 [Trueperaceae bacterium]